MAGIGFRIGPIGFRKTTQTGFRRLKLGCPDSLQKASRPKLASEGPPTFAAFPSRAPSHQSPPPPLSPQLPHPTHPPAPNKNEKHSSKMFRNGQRSPLAPRPLTRSKSWVPKYNTFRSILSVKLSFKKFRSKRYWNQNPIQFP